MKNLFLLFALLLVSCLHQKNESPNIILFMVDDLGWQDTIFGFVNETELQELILSGLKKQNLINFIILPTWKN